MPRLEYLDDARFLRYLALMQAQLIEAIDAALAGDWDGAHNIVQQYDDEYACWIHAVLHKIEGDKGNSRYWYAHTAHAYTDFADPQIELAAIKQELTPR